MKHTFEQIFRREGISAAWIEGDAFHRHDRAEMRQAMAEAEATGNRHFSHFGEAANLLEELEAVFATYAEGGLGRTRHYVHDAIEAAQHGTPAGTFTDWGGLPPRHRPAVLRRPAWRGENRKGGHRPVR